MRNAIAHDTLAGNVARVIGVAALGVGVVFVAMFAAAAALAIGIMIVGASIALKLQPQPRPARVDGRADVLDARRTPDGWVVETRSRRS